MEGRVVLLVARVSYRGNDRIRERCFEVNSHSVEQCEKSVKGEVFIPGEAKIAPSSDPARMAYERLRP